MEDKAAGNTEASGLRKRRLGGTRAVIASFSQQKLRAWQPVLTPKWIIGVFIGFAVLFLSLSVTIILATDSVVECVIPYEDPPNVCDDIYSCTETFQVEVTADNCVGPFTAGIHGPTFMYYELTSYYQNHRRYVKSRSDDQLRGQVFTSSDDVSSCDPIITDSSNRIYHPCGLTAWSVFNDTYELYDSDEAPITVDDSAAVIAWSADIGKFRNPDSAAVDSTLVNEWLNEQIFPGKVENGHFIVWMRSAALPHFRKLYGKITDTIHLPLRLTIHNRYPVSPFGGTKKVVLSTTSWLGGRNRFLGIAYLVVGIWCLVFGLCFLFRNIRHPRILGDVRYLNWVGKNKGAAR